MNLRFEEEAKKERKKKLIIELIRYVIEIILVIAFAWIIINFALKKVIMIGNSMENTISSGQELLVNTVFKHFVSPKRGSVIAFYPENTSDDESASDSNILIRRVAGLPGETIQMIEGIIYIDGEPVEEKYDFDRKVSAGRAEEKIRLGEDEYFVLSDKRTDLDDSRSDSFTTVKSDNIIGDVFLSLEPLSFISGPDEQSGDEPTESGQPEQTEE